MNEIEIINNIKKIIKNPAALKLNDDVFFDKKKSLVASIDTYNEKTHYMNFKYPNLIIKKAIRSSISDIISKGCDPKYLLISFTGSKKQFNKKNIQSILKSIKQEEKKYNFFLVGGDTTLSNKSSFTICTFSYSNKIVKRNNSSKNDDIYLTGNVGDASVGLEILKNNLKINKKFKKYFIDKFFKPNLSFGFHRGLLKFATSSMDISDGLLIDLKKITGDKNKGFIINYENIPKSTYFKKLVDQKKITPNKHLFNGDDYQILFTAKSKNKKNILKFASKWNQKITLIGNITSTKADYLKINTKIKKIVDYQGYIHNFW